MSNALYNLFLRFRLPLFLIAARRVDRWLLWCWANILLDVPNISDVRLLFSRMNFSIFLVKFADTTPQTRLLLIPRMTNGLQQASNRHFLEHAAPTHRFRIIHRIFATNYSAGLNEIIPKHYSLNLGAAYSKWGRQI